MNNVFVFLLAKQRKQSNSIDNSNGSSRSWRKKFHDHTGERKNGFQIVFLLQGSVFKSVLPWVIFFSLYSLLIALVRHWIQFNPLPGINTAVKDILLTFNLLLSLLLIFRTNSAHERYWEGRKLWGSLVNTTRNLSRGILIFISTSSPEQIAIKKHTLN
ncbi:MAG: hypothetical protein HC763_30410 [Hydrococcus sp. CRU_1_1]|nr:hypothetical protein [Hydrococcus sp. CRU_1_1]